MQSRSASATAGSVISGQYPASMGFPWVNVPFPGSCAWVLCANASMCLSSRMQGEQSAALSKRAWSVPSVLASVSPMTS